MTTLEILLLLVMIIANGVFAMSEIAIISARKIRLQQKAENGDGGARIALEMAESPSQLLSTVQIGITLIGIFAGAFGGATIAEEIEQALSGNAVLGLYSEAIGVIVVVVVTTYLSLVIGELVPKRLALNNAEQIAAAVARPMRLLSTIASPFVKILMVSTDALLRLLGSAASTEPHITEEEITFLIEQGIHEGVFKQTEHDIIGRVFDLDEQKIPSLMTPRRDIVWLDLEDPIQETIDKVIASGHSYFPLCRGDLDHPLGILSVKTLWSRARMGEPIKLDELATPMLFAPESSQVFNVLKLLQENRHHMALIIDEFGGIEGLITLTDLLEALVGDLPSIEDSIEEVSILKRDDGTWLVDGLLSLDALKHHFEFLRAVETKTTYHTLSGFMMDHLERIPRLGDKFELQGYQFEVVDMDGHRVDKVLITPIA